MPPFSGEAKGDCPTTSSAQCVTEPTATSLPPLDHPNPTRPTGKSQPPRALKKRRAPQVTHRYNLRSRFPLLDHRMFPHIMDMIFQAAPRESLFVFRRTSRDMCARADAMLGAHVLLRDWAVYDDPLSKATALLASGERFPLMDTFQHGKVPSGAIISRLRRFLPHVKVAEVFAPLHEHAFCVGAQPHRGDRFREAPGARQRRVAPDPADHVSPYCIHPSKHITKDDFDGVHTLKIHPTYKYHDVNGPVWFQHIKSYVGFPLFDFLRGNSTLGAGVSPLPSFVERVVLSLFGFHVPCWNYYTGDVWLFEYPDSVREVVIIAQEIAFDADDDNMLEDGTLGYATAYRQAYRGRNRRSDMFESLVNLDRLGGIHYTLVDFHCPLVYDAEEEVWRFGAATHHTTGCKTREAW